MSMNQVGLFKEENDDEEEEISFDSNRVSSPEEECLLGSQSHESQDVVIKRRLNVLHCVSILLSGIIGSGIFISPHLVLKNSGSVGLTFVVWTLCGVVAMLGSLCYCELGTLIGKSGAEYIYLKSVFGPLPGYLVCWADVWFLGPTANAIIPLTMAHYLVTIFFPSIECENAELTIKLVAAIGILFVTAVNCFGIRFSARLNVVFSTAKILAIVTVVVCGVTWLAQGRLSETLKPPFFRGSKWKAGKIGHAFYGGLWAYGGWNTLNSVTEELQTPAKTLPRSIFIALPIVTVCYLVINLAYFAMLTPAEMLTSPAVAVTATGKVHAVFLVVTPLFVACSCLGTMNVGAFAGPRLLFSMAREGQMPRVLGMVHKDFQTPIPAILFRTTLNLILILPTNIETLLNWLSFGAWVSFGATFLAVIVLRWKKPSDPRPFKVPIIIPIIMVLFSLYFVVVPFVSQPAESAYGLIIILLGIPVYYGIVSRKHRLPVCLVKFMDKLTITVQLLTNAVEPANPWT